MVRKLAFIVATLGLIAAACGDSGDAATTRDVVAAATSTSASVVETTSVAPSSPITADVETATTETAPTNLIVMADDGEAVLEIPPGALPSDVDPGSIRVSRSQSLPAGVGEDLEAAGLELVRTYELLPDGIVFAQPAVLRVPLDRDSGLLTTAFLIGDSEIQALGFLEEEPATDGTVGILVPHFSVITIAVGIVRHEFTWPDRPVVDVPFVVTSRVYRLPGSVPYERFHLVGVLYTGRADSGFTANLNPERAIFPTQQSVAGRSATSNLTLICTAPGKAEMVHAVYVNRVGEGLTDLILAELTGLQREGQLSWVGEIVPDLECVAPGAARSVAGTYDGTLEIGAVEGAPGGVYSDQFQLVLDDCGAATLIQRGSQMSAGWYFPAGPRVQLSVRGGRRGICRGF